MYTAESQTVSEEYKAENTQQFIRRYHLDGGNEREMTISDPLLDNDAAAEQRAKAEFLKNGYKLRPITFTTHLTDVLINDIVNVRGLPYVAKSINVTYNGYGFESRIKAVRYEQ